MKKNILKYIIPGLLLFASCDDFLEQQSQDLIRPETATHYQELLVGEGYFHHLMEKGWFVELMTDNVELYENSSEEELMLPAAVQDGEDCFLWKREIEDHLVADRLYKNIYGNILAANTCLLDVDDIKGTEEEKRILKGQASFVRAYGYFVLANLYSQAYNEADVDKDLCVPLVMQAKPTLEKFKRNTVKEVWAQIKFDAENAVNNLEKVERLFTVYEINYNAALLLAARVALYMEDYESVINYGEKYLELNPVLYDISNGSTGDKAFLDPLSNPEIVFNFGSKYEYGFLDEYTGTNQFAFRVYNTTEQSLMNAYDAEDGRVNAFFEEPEISSWFPVFNKERWMPKKYDKYDKTGLRQAFRTSEVYLMMAEAYARKENPDNSKAISNLNTLRSKRIKDYVELSSSYFSTQEELVQFVWDERRRELCFEEFHRWWDLRRIGQPAIRHNWKGGEIYELQEKDPAYLLNFPMEERNYNTALVPNPRPDRVAIN